MLVSLQPLMEYANQNGCAIGAFNCPNLESVRAIVSGAEETGTPVILNYAEVHGDLISMEEIGGIMIQYAKRATVPICVHLDHGESLESCVKAMDLGFTSVMIDQSAKPFAENVQVTKEVVDLAHARGVTVEAELGHIFVSEARAGQEGGVEIETVDSFASLDDVYTNPEMAKEFVEKTGVDVLAIAFGTSHGIYKHKPVLDVERISLIKEAIDIPFVMHGGSGLSEEEFRASIKNGIRKINYYTYMTLAGGKAVKEAMDALALDDNIFFHDIPLIAERAMKENVVQTIRTFSMK
ncbi:fructose-bisphosphate aldolase class II [Lachnospiraceae bacterium PM6-15]|uniref:class II fructose-bisphosphate aldolase n=1 Tax=Ohessyouella blattaphilus TaxID=2949333 RepID=UPI003E2E90EE